MLIGFVKDGSLNYERVVVVHKLPTHIWARVWWVSCEAEPDGCVPPHQEQNLNGHIETPVPPSEAPLRSLSPPLWVYDALDTAPALGN